MSKFKLEIPDFDYWRRQIKCQDACPVHTDARGYVRAIAEGDYKKAYFIARGPNPFASICGRVCGAPCEINCRRGSIDQPISIRGLKRFVCEKFGAEAYLDQSAKFFNEIITDQDNKDCQDYDELKHLLAYIKETVKKPSQDGPKIAIIGAGPAGLAAAHDLALLGFRPIVYEMEPVPAGMLYVGVPEYRLPRELIKAEVDVIQSLGVEIICNTKVGKDIAFKELINNHAAVIIAVGAKKSRPLPIPGANAMGVLGGVDFLRTVALGEKVELGEKVIVIGGGNVAYDVARTVLRQEEYDVSRTALRQANVREVHLCCLESLEEMPADTVEIKEGQEEGVFRHNSLGPKEILTKDSNRVRGVLFRKVLSVYDENKRFSPQYDDTTLTTLDADTVILSIGQSPDLSFIQSVEDGVELTDRGMIKSDPHKLNTTHPKVFVAGDIAHGTRLMIDAIASGKRVARSVYEYLSGKSIHPNQLEIHFPIEDYKRENDYEKKTRFHIPVTEPSERVKSMKKIVERGYTENEARDEANRCLDCGINTIFDGDKCILCGGCVDVCPEYCLKIVSLNQIEIDADFQKLVDHRYDDYPAEQGSAIIKDEEKCIRCALCAYRCPTGAITMERFQFEVNWK